MSNKLKDKLIEDLGAASVSVEVVPVPSKDAPKVYQIELNGEMYFDWKMTPPSDVEVILKPNDDWKFPINFETHTSYFGPGLGEEGGEVKQAMYDSLKAAVQSKA